MQVNFRHFLALELYLPVQQIKAGAEIAVQIQKNNFLKPLSSGFPFDNIH